MNNPSNWVAIPEEMARLTMKAFPLRRLGLTATDTMYLLYREDEFKFFPHTDPWGDKEILYRHRDTWFIHVNKLHLLKYESNPG